MGMLKSAIDAGKREFRRSKRQFVRFSAVGISNGIVDFAVYLLLTRVIFDGLGFIVVAKAIASIVATTWSFFMNRYITFGLRDKWNWQELIHFLVGMGPLLNIATHYIAVYVFDIHDLIGVVLAAGASATWGFAFSKYYVFKKYKKQLQDDEV